MIVVLDSNVWISALHFRGLPLAVLRKAYVNERIAWCNEIRDEVERTLVEKLGWRPANASLAMNAYLDSALHIPMTGTLTGICRDPQDDMIFECAPVARAQWIVTGDRDLLAVGDYGPIRVLTPRAYLDLRPDETTP